MLFLFTARYKNVFWAHADGRRYAARADWYKLRCISLASRFADYAAFDCDFGADIFISETAISAHAREYLIIFSRDGTFVERHEYIFAIPSSYFRLATR